jgi:hypothetical protein
MSRVFSTTAVSSTTADMVLPLSENWIVKGFSAALIQNIRRTFRKKCNCFCKEFGHFHHGQLGRVDAAEDAVYGKPSGALKEAQLVPCNTDGLLSDKELEDIWSSAADS